MQTKKTTVLLSVLFGFAMEFQINVLLHGSIPSFIAALLLYAVIGLVTYTTFPFLIRQFTSPRRGFWVSLVVHGLAGLIIIEWGFMGNTFEGVAPGAHPLIILAAQLGMFAWWATIAAMPYLLQHSPSIPFRKKIFCYYGTYAVISTILAIPFGMAPVILLEPPVYLGFFYFYHKIASNL